MFRFQIKHLIKILKASRAASLTCLDYCICKTNFSCKLKSKFSLEKFALIEIKFDLGSSLLRPPEKTEESVGSLYCLDGGLLAFNKELFPVESNGLSWSNDGQTMFHSEQVLNTVFLLIKYVF